MKNEQPDYRKTTRPERCMATNIKAIERGRKMNSDEYRLLRLEIEPLKARVRELEEVNAELVQKVSALADYFDLEWYDVPCHECYIGKGGKNNGK